MGPVIRDEQPVTMLEREDPAKSRSSSQEEISILDLLIRIVQDRRLILKATVGGAIFGLVVAFVWPIRYTASTTILPPQQGSSIGTALMAQLGALGSVASLAGGSLGGLKNPNDQQVAILKSQTIEDAMVTRFHLLDLYHKKRMSDARKKFEGRTSIDSGTKDGLIRISITDSDARRATEMANGYVDEYMKRTASLAVTEASQRRLFFEKQLEKAKNDLADAEESLKKTEQQTGMVQLDSQARAVIELVAQLRAQIAAKEVQIQALQSYATADNPELQIAEQELAGLKTQQEKLGARASGAGTISDLGIPKGTLPQYGLDYVRKLRDVKYYETIFELLARQYEIAKVDEARQGNIVQVVDVATIPDKRSSPKRLLIVTTTTILGLFFGVLCSFIRGGLERISEDPKEKERLDTLRSLIARKRAQA